MKGRLKMPSSKPVIITTTAPDRAEAEKIGGLLLSEQLAACVQYDEIRSQYVWDGEIRTDSEIRITIKTTRNRYGKIEKLIRQHHSYDCPQILMVTVSRGFKPYLAWLRNASGQGG